MGDLIGHLVDAPLANLLILAGLVFLGIAVVGKISGKVEPGQAGRIMAGVLGSLLFIFGVQVHLAADRERTTQKDENTKANSPHEPIAKKTEKTAPASPFRGQWRNGNPQTRGITKLEIGQQGAVLLVHAWGACHPQDCDWGAEKGAVTADSASVAWDQGFVLRRMTLTPDAGRLHVVVDSVYRDRRPPHRLEEYFVKSP